MNSTKQIEKIQEQLNELRPHPIDQNSPAQGGCWVCRRGNGWEETDEFKHSGQLNIFYHSFCLEKLDLEDEEELISLIEKLKENNS